MRKLNFGCGNRIASGWENIDFSPVRQEVRRVNLLKGFPYPNDSFDVVYSSHVLEHFSKEQAIFLLSEAARVLKPGGIIRIVVPDLEQICGEYLKVLEMDDSDPNKMRFYNWIIVELFDQMVRMKSGGEMGRLMASARKEKNSDFSRYVEQHSEKFLDSNCCPAKPGTLRRLRNLNWDKIKNHILLLDLKIAKLFVPRAIRPLVFVETSIGERHQWMYDYFGMKQLFTKAGFTKVIRRKYNESEIDGFNTDFLDMNQDGSQYKGDSLYVEGIK